MISGRARRRWFAICAICALGVASFAILTILTILPGCTKDSPPAGGSRTPDVAPSPNGFTTFADGTAAAGITFERQNGFDTRSWRVVETVNGGVALFDYDGDGRLDIYFTNGRRLAAGPSPSRNALYRNVGGRFEDVSKISRTDDAALSLGCAVADFDGDGRSDLYVTNLGPNRLYRNSAAGTFEDVASTAGVAGNSMDSGCVFFDMDRDGDLDLYVASYVIDDRTEHRPLLVHGVPGYWPPLNYEPAPDHLYENLGDGKFRDVSARSGIRDVAPGRGLGVLASDFDSDGFADLYVANDMTANFLFIGDGKGRFSDIGFLSGAGLGHEGEALGSMGVDACDFDGSGGIDLVVTNYQGQVNNFYRAVGSDQYVEAANVVGIGAGSFHEVSWGVGFVDLDSDGWQDLFVGNGHLNPHTRGMNDATSYEQANRVFRNLRGASFQDLSRECGDALRVRQVTRGVAFGDLDNDGDVDVVVLNSHGAPQVLLNQRRGDRAWALVRLVGSKRNRDAIGARVTIAAAGRRQWRERRSAESYLSANDPRLHFGLGSARRIERLDVRWPDGQTESHSDLPVKRLITVRQGSGEVGVEEVRQ